MLLFALLYALYCASLLLAGISLLLVAGLQEMRSRDKGVYLSLCPVCMPMLSRGSVKAMLVCLHCLWRMLIESFQSTQQRHALGNAA